MTHGQFTRTGGYWTTCFIAVVNDKLIFNIHESVYIREHEIFPTPPHEAKDWKVAYINQAKALWCERLIQPRIGPETITSTTLTTKDSNKLYDDKGKGKF